MFRIGGFVAAGGFSRAVYSSSCDKESTASCAFSFTQTSSDRQAGTGGGSQDDSSCPVSFEHLRSGRVWGQKWDSQWDGCRSGANNDVKHQILLIRHGQYRNESSGRPDSERTLTDLGIEQSKLTGRFLQAMLTGETKSELFPVSRIDAIYSSDLTRAIQTCEYITDEINDSKRRWAAPDPMLAERFVCDPEPAYPKRARPECQETVERAFKRYITRPRAGVDQPQTSMLVCHANVIRYMVCRALQLPPEAWLRIALPHASITSINVRGSGNVSIGMLGAATHLPPNLQTVHNKAGA